jgi:hypothetical protein
VAESLHHLELVKAILDYIAREHCQISYLALLHDLPGAIRGEKPPRIGGYLPDVYAVDAPCTITIIGEAKTVKDLETDHSRRQIRAFTEFLVHKERGILVVSVPWHAGPRARGIVGHVCRSLDTSAMNFVYLDGSNPYRAPKC